MNRAFVFQTFLLAALCVAGQNVTNLNFELQADKVIVTYDLDMEADIYLFAQIDENDGWNTSFMNYSAYRSDAPALRAVWGDAGKRVAKGRGKQIIWKYPIEVMPFLGGKSEYGLIETVVYSDKKKKDSHTSTKIMNSLQMKIEAYPSTDEPDLVYIDGLDGLGDYWIGRYEVTMREFAAFVNETDYVTDAEKKGYGEIWSLAKNDWEKKKGMSWRCDVAGNPRPFSDYDRYPVTNVSHNDATAYCKWLSGKYNKAYSLPSFENWLEVAQGTPPGNHSFSGLHAGTGKFKYSGSDNINEVGWCSTNSDYKIHPVGQKKPNDSHVYDMNGNVNEWCYNYYDKEKELISRGYSEVKEENLSDMVWIGCGGSCFEKATSLDMVDCAKTWAKDVAGVNIGFRVVMAVSNNIYWTTGKTMK